MSELDDRKFVKQLIDEALNKEREKFLEDWRWVLNIIINKDRIMSTEDIEKLHKLDKKWEGKK